MLIVMCIVEIKINISNFYANVKKFCFRSLDILKMNRTFFRIIKTNINFLQNTKKNKC